MIKMLLRLIPIVALSVCSYPVLAQDYPSKPIDLVVPFSSGGSIDTLARLVAPPLSEALGQPVAVQNKPGASGAVGEQFVVGRDADGYTLLMHGLPFLTRQYLTNSSGAAPLEQFDPVTILALQPNVMVVNPELGIDSLEAFIDYAKAHPGEANFGSSGVGATQHLAAAQLMDKTGIEMVHVPYQGGGPAMVDLLGSRLQTMIETAPSAIPYVRSGQLVPIGVTATQRIAALPDVPTIAEAGVPGYELVSWIILLAAEGTPEAVVDTVSGAVAEVLKSPEVVKQLDEIGLIPDGRSPAEATTFLANQETQYHDLIESVGAMPN